MLRAMLPSNAVDRLQRETVEPQLAVLREDNNVITKRLLAYREKQNNIVQSHDALRVQKADTAESKVRMLLHV